jgi:hypothetical protein
MLITGLNRERLLTVLPKGGTVAEVGVLRGYFARHIRSIVEPERLHLIDPWGHDDESYRDAKIAKLHEAYETVQENFRDDIAGGRVILHRDFSTRAARAFANHYFDWVYIDARHDYDNARADLLAFKDKVKPDGFILGHDFSNYRNPRAFGVVAAVREFTKTEGFDLVALTNETNPSYVLARTGNDTTLPALRAALLNHEEGRPIELNEALLERFEQVAVTYPDGREGQIMRFG